MPGHTPGSVGVIVSLPSGKRYIFIGDTAWAKEGVDWPAEKPWMPRRIVDTDPGLVRDWLVLLHALQKQHPTPIIVPAHDLRVHQKIAKFPAFER